MPTGYSSNFINILYTVCSAHRFLITPLFTTHTTPPHRLLFYTATSYCCHILRTKARERVTIFTRVTRTCSRENG
jgi:hypothetical protein